MATMTSTEIVGDQCLELRGLDWEGYKTMLRLRGERPVPRMVYLDGTLFLMSPSFPHERLGERLGYFVMEVVVGLNIPFVPAGHTTLRRRTRRGGVEADKSFYLANEARVRGKNRIKLRFDPPPDLAIEAVYSHGATAAVAVLRRLRVPEIWVCGEFELRILVRRANGRYVKVEASAAFPFLTAAEIFAWVQRPQSVSETEWVKELRVWVRDTLLPRRQAHRADG